MFGNPKVSYIPHRVEQSVNTRTFRIHSTPPMELPQDKQIVLLCHEDGLA